MGLVHDFNRLRRMNLDLNAISDDYFKRQEELKVGILKFLGNYRMTSLTKKQLLDLMCLISSHRPLEPWQFLTRVSMDVDAIREGQV